MYLHTIEKRCIFVSESRKELLKLKIINYDNSNRINDPKIKQRI